MDSIRDALKRSVSRSLFDARWIMAPFYFGLVLVLMLLLVVFFRELGAGVLQVATLGPSKVVLLALKLIDLSLVANLLLIVILAGYENFVAKVECGDQQRPSWIGTVDFAAMKMKVMSSIIAISAISLLGIFMQLADGETIDLDGLLWMGVIHGTLLLSALVLAITDRLSRSAHSGGSVD